MKTLVLYATRYGSTRLAAERIAAALGGADVHELSAHAPAPGGYDEVIVGAPVYMGRLLKPARAYLAAHCPELKRVRLGLFACGAMPAGADGCPQCAFPPELREHARAICAAGGVVRPAGMRPLDRLVIGMIARGEHAGLLSAALDDAAIARFARELRA